MAYLQGLLLLVSGRLVFYECFFSPKQSNQSIPGGFLLVARLLCKDCERMTRSRGLLGTTNGPAMGFGERGGLLKRWDHELVEAM